MLTCAVCGDVYPDWVSVVFSILAGAVAGAAADFAGATLPLPFKTGRGFVAIMGEPPDCGFALGAPTVDAATPAFADVGVPDERKGVTLSFPVTRFIQFL